MRSNLLVISLVVLLAASVFGASAFTTAYVDRSATIQLTTDPNGLVGLADGNSGDLVQISGDKLNIDFSQAGGSGANVDGKFELGDPNNGNTTYAFNVTNNDNSAHTLSLDYTLDSADADSGANVTFKVFDSTDTELLSATDENGEQSSAADALSSGETVHVVIIVDTTGKTSSDDLSGTLRVKLS